LLLGVPPSRHDGAYLHPFAQLAQMTCDVALEDVDGPEIVALGDAQRADVLALTALVYPHYFRPRTMDMGRYFGIYRDGRLAAMIGERMGSETSREISAVCTHPDFLGHGYARRLMAMLTNDLLGRGVQPFLHVSHENERGHPREGGDPAFAPLLVIPAKAGIQKWCECFPTAGRSAARHAKGPRPAHCALLAPSAGRAPSMAHFWDLCHASRRSASRPDDAGINLFPNACVASNRRAPTPPHPADGPLHAQPIPPRRLVYP
jgi:GNAT superfamily N-acetyltransferase